MDFYFTDRKFNLLGVASTSGSTDISLANEEDKLSIEDSVRTLTGSLFYGPESRKQAEAMSALGNYVLYKDESGRSVWTTIMEINNDPLAGECVFLAEDAGVDLINELVGPYTADKAYPIASYISRFTYDSGFSIGINEISNLSRKLEWESDESTALARILSVATQFDNAELEFRFEVNGLQVVERYIDIFKKRGKDERVTLYVDKDINRITTSGNLYELGTSLYGIGGTPEGKDNPITLKGYKYTDKTGRYILGSDGIMRDTVAVQKWSRLLSNDNPAPKSSHIQRRKTYETTDQKTLCDDVLRDLKKMAEVELNYEAEIVSLPYGVKIGDTIYLVDEQGELYLSARVLELVRCYSEDRYLATLGNYLIKDSGVDVNLQEIADKLKDQVKPGDTYYPWTRYADDDQGNGMSAVPDGKTYMATIHRKNDPIPSDNPEDYAGLWVKIKGDDGIPGKDGEQGPQGNPGPPGADGQDGLPGKDGVGVQSTAIQYAQSTSGTTAPTSGWTTSVPTLTKGRYLWTRTIWTYTDNSTETGYTVSYNAKDGNNGTDGIAGKDGVGITSTLVEYAKSTSGTTKPTSGWSTTIPSVPAGQYLWTRTTWSYTDNTSEQGFSAAKMGDTGPKGDPGSKGEPGTPGADGRTPYLHTAYKMSDGTFTDTYPGENHVLKSKEGYSAIGNGNTNQYPSAINNIPFNPDILGKEATIQYKVTISNYVSGTYLRLKMFDAVGVWTSFGEWNNISGNSSKICQWKGTLPALKTGGRPEIDFNTDLGADILIEELQIKKGLEYQLYTPSPFEDYENAYPLWKGTYTDYLEDDSQNPDDYVWERILGESGADGIGIANTKTDYQLHTSATTPPTGTWVTSPPAVTVGKYLWTRTILEYTDGTKSTPAYSVSGGPGANGSDGKDGQDGAPGADALPIFSGYVTNEAIILSATNSGAVSDFSKATGSFVTYLGQDQLTSGVTYSRVSQSGVTAAINQTTGAYSVTAASADTGMVVFKAVYQGIEIQKIVSVTKAKQGNTGDTGAKGSDGKDGATGVKGEPGEDGISSYLHTAWKMADGTFSPEYPGENLIIREGEFKNSWINTNGDIVSLPMSANHSVMKDYIPVKAGEVYTCSRIKSAYDGGGYFRYRFLAEDESYISRAAVIQLIASITIPDGASYIQVSYPDDSMPKMELGSAATIYTPAPSEDYSLAYPKYRGEYTDTIEADSTDPNRYTWTAYLGEQGPPTGVISQNTVPSSPYVGMLWQCTGNIAGYINPATYRWNGSSWEIYQFTAHNIMADTFTGFTFQGVKMIASEFISHQEFNRVIQPAPESIIENHVTDISIADGRLLIETNVDTIHDFSAGVKWTDQVRMETTVDDTLGFIIDGTRLWGQDDTMSYSTLIQNSEYIALLPNSRDAMSENDMVTNNNWRNVVATKHCGRQLWEGGQHMTSNHVVTPTAKLSDCLNGWLLQWQRYNPGVGLDNSRYFYQPITKGHPSGKGITTYISAPASDTNNGGVPAATKYVYVTDTTITGYDANSVSPGNNWALSGVFGW
ncbi:phage tail protein [Enterococcus asini]|uniref:phage tail protein n=1 Tax=Enterococcus asini TaxID=57732 RepID=UPI0032E36B92